MIEPKVDTLSETWLAVLDEIDKMIVARNKLREDASADLRSLDRNLGGIKALEYLKHLADRQQKQTPETIRGSGVRVAGVNHAPKVTR